MYIYIYIALDPHGRLAEGCHFSNKKQSACTSKGAGFVFNVCVTLKLAQVISEYHWHTLQIRADPLSFEVPDPSAPCGKIRLVN